MAARRYGLAANSVTAVDVVTPDGRLARADADHDLDLFWAVRGGSGSVGRGDRAAAIRPPALA